MIKVDWVRAVQVRIVGDVDRLRIQHAAAVGLRVETEGVAVLAKAVKVGLLRQIGAQADILLFEDQRSASGIEDGLVVAVANDLEAKGLSGDVESNSRIRRSGLVVCRPGQGFLLHLKHVETRIVDLDMETVVYNEVNYWSNVGLQQPMIPTSLVLNNQLQLLEIFAVGITSSASESEVGGQARVRHIDVGSCVSWTRGRVRLSRENEGGSVVRVRRGKSEARARRKRDEGLDQHGARRLSCRVDASAVEEAFTAGTSTLYASEGELVPGISAP